MKIFFFKLLLILAPVALLVAASNFWVDPANLFSSEKYVAGVADIIASGHNVNNVSNYDERLLQAQVVKKVAYKPDVVVLGSSRIMEVGKDLFGGSVVLNCAVSHANIYDLVAIVGLLDSANKLPGKVVINLDPHLVCLGGTSEWQTLSPYFDSFLSKLAVRSSAPYKVESLVWKKFYSLLSFEYFEKSLDFVVKGKSKRYVDVGYAIPDSYGRFADGTICYPAAYMHPDTLKVAGDARVVGGQEEVAPDSSKIYLLKATVDFLRKKNIDVSFILLPYHPVYYDVMDRRWPGIFNKYDALFHAIAMERNIPVLGGFDAGVVGIPASQFYDAHHCSRDALHKVINN